ncbi:unnamed protein product [Heligmosomoides polygyrus]|uniref:BSD domain-containing protein n=1 Tax=Heligmosomoides polygyrus TaxID=6339 RepID=A0A3P7Y1J8_HELPZ|nr:unnamed protein product [Heligmosomoides polygyrus]
MDTSELLLTLDHVKYRKAGDGRSPVGRLLLYREHIEWRDNAGPEILYVKFMQIKGQRVSPPNKSKVQLQLVLQNDDQATFVFLNPALDKEGLIKERDLLKETLQQSLIAHRQRVNQLAVANEHDVKQTELREKQRILGENKHLDQLYTHLVASKLISAQDFWTDYYSSLAVANEHDVKQTELREKQRILGENKHLDQLYTHLVASKLISAQDFWTDYYSSTGMVEDKTVEKKHLELVPHEMTEAQFWTKFFQSHYFHREREVLPSPNDPFSDCVRMDEAEMEKMQGDGVFRKRFDIEHLDDNVLRELTKAEVSKGSQKSTLVRRCNYLSEKILTELKPSTSNAADGSNDNRSAGFDVLNRIIDEEEGRLESDELQEYIGHQDCQSLNLKEDREGTNKSYLPEEAANYKGIVLSLLESSSDDVPSWGERRVVIRGAVLLACCFLLAVTG